MSKLVDLAYAASQAWYALGHERVDVPHALVVRDHTCGNVYDANFAAAVRASTEADIGKLLARLDEVFAGCEHRHVLWDPGMPAAFEARLVLDGYRLQNDVVTLALEGELCTRGPEIAIRVAQSDADWQWLDDMHWLDHQEEVALGFHEAWDRSVTSEILAAKRRKTPSMRYLIAQIDGVDCGFFSAWPGHEGVGVIEDLYTRKEFRGRGVATALTAACVDDARARGARAVLVGPRATDTPKQMYAALGFRPLCVQRSYLKLPAARTPSA